MAHSREIGLEMATFRPLIYRAKLEAPIGGIILIFPRTVVPVCFWAYEVVAGGKSKPNNMGCLLVRVQSLFVTSLACPVTRPAEAKYWMEASTKRKRYFLLGLGIINWLPIKYSFGRT